MYPKQLEFCNNGKLIYSDNEGNIYYKKKKIIKSDMINFKYIKFKKENINIFDKNWLEFIYFILSFRMTLNTIDYVSNKLI